MVEVVEDGLSSNNNAAHLNDSCNKTGFQVSRFEAQRDLHLEELGSFKFATMV
jgi:molybdopterin-biosynthesis enzyme MoeA-like protein